MRLKLVINKICDYKVMGKLWFILDRMAQFTWPENSPSYWKYVRDQRSNWPENSPYYWEHIRKQRYQPIDTSKLWPVWPVVGENAKNHLMEFRRNNFPPLHEFCLKCIFYDEKNPCWVYRRRRQVPVLDTPWCLVMESLNKCR